MAISFISIVYVAGLKDSKPAQHGNISIELTNFLYVNQSFEYSRRSVLSQNTTDNQPAQQQPPQQPDMQPQQQPQQPPQQPLDQFQQLPHGRFDQSQNNPSSFSGVQQPISLNILTPSTQPTSTHMNIPGLIPLIPLNQQEGAASSALPLNLTDEDLRILSTTTRDAMEQRLRILQTVQDQIFQTMQTLSQVLSVLPINNEPTEDVHKEENNSHNEPESSSSAAKSATEKDVKTAEHEDELSDRQRQKLPNYTATTISDCNNSDDDNVL